MAKRFTASDKWKDKWFSELSSKYKLFWIYLLDECDFAGFWEVNFKAASFFIGEEIDEKEAEIIFNKRFIKVNEDKWFIPKFISFQYGELSATSKMHKNIIEKLNKYGMLDYVVVKGIENSSSRYENNFTGYNENDYRVASGWRQGASTLQEKEKEKEKEMDKEEVKEKETENDFVNEKNKPKEEEVVEFGIKIGMSEEEARKFFLIYDSQDWRTNGEHSRKISNWKSKMKLHKLDLARRARDETLIAGRIKAPKTLEDILQQRG